MCNSSDSNYFARKESQLIKNNDCKEAPTNQFLNDSALNRFLKILLIPPIQSLDSILDFDLMMPSETVEF